jgi:hypothetical protein
MHWVEFLADTPPGVTEEIEDLFKKGSSFAVNEKDIKVSDADIQIYCDDPKCRGIRFFHTISVPEVDINVLGYYDVFVEYWCRNCQYKKKTFALRVTRPDTSSLGGTAIKFGEIPAFGPPVPTRLVSLVGPDRDAFLRGRRAENQGLGIGAFAYYRRIVENQKGRFIGQISQVSKRLGASKEVLDKFDQAAQETQFSKAVDMVRDAIPQVLFINEHNPLTLLHSALSEGLHEKTDEECLELATSIRIILTDLSERISIALKDEAELKQALSNLMRRSSS